MCNQAVSLLVCSATVFCLAGPVRGLDWTSETVESGYAGWGSSVCVNSAGYPLVSYYALFPAVNKSYLRIAEWQGTSWNIQTVEPVAEGWSDSTSIALDGSDRPHVAYNTGLAGQGPRYAAWDGASWQLMTVDGAIGVSPALGLDSTENARIVYSDVSGPNRYAVRNGSSWDIEVADQAGTYGFPAGCLAIDENDVTHVAGNSASGLAYAKRDAQGWSGQNGIGETTWRTSMDLDDAGNPHMAHVSGTDDILRYTHWNGNAWETEVVDDNLHWQGGASLVLDQLGRPRIGYLKHDEQRGGGTYPFYAAWNGQHWEIECIPSERAIGSYGLSMAVQRQRLWQ